MSQRYSKNWDCYLRVWDDKHPNFPTRVNSLNLGPIQLDLLFDTKLGNSLLAILDMLGKR